MAKLHFVQCSKSRAIQTLLHAVPDEKTHKLQLLTEHGGGAMTTEK